MSLDHHAMRNEPVFDADDLYQRIVEHNVLLHREAANVCQTRIAAWLTARELSQPLCVLDLACGGYPVTISQILGAFPDVQWNYTGIDINAAQVRRSREAFRFPKNVAANFFEDDVWMLQKNPDPASYDLIFIGLNTHHATARELASAADLWHTWLRPGGLLINHDLFRPERFAYLPRPDDRGGGVTVVGWRNEFCELDAILLRRTGLSEESVMISLDHIRERDFPVSTQEMQTILQRAGFVTSIHDFHSTDHLLRDYFAVVMGEKTKHNA